MHISRLDFYSETHPAPELYLKLKSRGFFGTEHWPAGSGLPALAFAL